MRPFLSISIVFLFTSFSASQAPRGTFKPGFEYDARLFYSSTQKHFFDIEYPDFDSTTLEKSWEWRDVDPLGLFTPEENRKRRREQFLHEYTPYKLNDAEGEPTAAQNALMKVVQEKLGFGTTVLMRRSTLKIIISFANPRIYETIYDDSQEENFKNFLREITEFFLGIVAEYGLEWKRLGGSTVLLYHDSILTARYRAGYVSLADWFVDKPPVRVKPQPKVKR